MADAASVTLQATVLPDEIQKTFSSTMTVEPADGTEKWYYKLTSVPNTSAQLMAGYFLDYTAVDADTSPSAISGSSDKVKFLYVKNTDSAESVYIVPEALVFTAGDFVIGDDYVITTAGTTDFTTIGSADSNVGTTFTASGATVTAGSFVVGQKYEIVTAGTTDFTLIGAADSNVGTVFTASGVGTGTGTAEEQDTAGSGTGTATFAATATEPTGIHLGPNESLAIRLPNQTVDKIHAVSSAGTVECIVCALLDDV